MNEKTYLEIPNTMVCGLGEFLNVTFNDNPPLSWKQERAYSGIYVGKGLIPIGVKNYVYV